MPVVRDISVLGGIVVSKVIKSASIVVLLGACSQKPEVQNFKPQTSLEQNLVMSNGAKFVVKSNDLMMDQFVAGNDPDDLQVGIAKSDLSKTYYFGGTIIGTTSDLDENLSMLKLSGIKPQRVIIKHQRQGLKEKLVLLSCSMNCAQNPFGEEIFELPLLSSKPQDEYLYIDLNTLGKALNFYQYQDPTGSYFHYVSTESSTSQVEFSEDTLLFDIVSKLKGRGKNKDKNADLTTRWYLKSVIDPSAEFEQRELREEVGFFPANNMDPDAIMRHDLYKNGNYAEIKVYAKNFPKVLEPSVVEAIEQWNDVFENQMGNRPIVLEILDKNSEENNQIVMGDPRYNVIEWDVANLAPYDGLGPSMPDPKTGRILSSQSNIQGPNIVLRTVMEFGDTTVLNELDDPETINMVRAIYEKTIAKDNQQVDIEQLNLTLKVGDVEMYHPAKDPSVTQIIPFQSQMQGFSFIHHDSKLSAMDYLKGYVRAVVAHEFGHNLGLRHNFKGNLGANEERVSHSVMDYVHYLYSHKMNVEEYDAMAIAYGYFGQSPYSNEMFCTDEHVFGPRNPEGSPECMRFDATADPYGFFQDIIMEVKDRTLRDANGNVEDLNKYTWALYNGLGQIMTYVKRADSIDTWKNYGLVEGRAETKVEFMGEVESFIKELKCGDRPLSPIAGTLKNNFEIMDSIIDQVKNSFIELRNSDLSCDFKLN